MVQDASDLLALPVVDLVEAPLEELAALLRREQLPADQEIEALDRILRLKVIRALQSEPDHAALVALVGELRRLVPHDRCKDLDARRRPWATRWSTLGDLVDCAAQAIEARDPARAKQLAHAAPLLAAVGDSPGLAQAELGRRLGIKPANLSRILGVLEAGGLVRRKLVGREKLVHPARDAMPDRAPARAGSGARRGASYLQRTDAASAA